jgi:DNA-binding PadR family transcriptional regulator
VRDDDPAILDLLPLPAAALYIVTVLGNGPMHGYGLMSHIRDLSAGAVTLGPGTLYGSIKRMLAQGLLVEATDRPDSDGGDGRRRYYELTDLGRHVAAAEHARLANLLAAARPKPMRRAVVRPAT